MARTKVGRKRVVKKQKYEGELQKNTAFTFHEKESGDHNEIPNISSRVAQKSVVQVLDPLKPSAPLSEATPASQRGRAFRTKKLTDVFTKLPNPISIGAKKVSPAENISPASTAKENDVVPHSVPPNNDGSAGMTKNTGIRVEQNVEMEQEETVQPVSSNAAQSSYPREQQQRTMNFYFYPLQDAKKWVKKKIPEPKPQKKVVTRKLRKPTTDELTSVLLWESPSRKKRTLRDLTDVEVALTVVKRTVTEFSGCATDSNIIRFIKKYEEYFERGIVKKLRSIEAAKKMQEEINQLKRENKRLSSTLGSLTDRKMRFAE